MEDLLKPRYKVISDYPENGRPIGHIIDVYDSLFNKESVFELNSHIDFYERYPHLFRKMDWWEDRKPEEMPEYVKWRGSKNKEITRVKEWGKNTVGVYCFIGESSVYNYLNECNLLPATLSEYLNQNH